MLFLLIALLAILLIGFWQAIELLVAVALIALVIWAFAAIIGAGFSWGFRRR